MSPRCNSPSPPRITVLGGANTDFLVRAARLPHPGEAITGTEFDHAAAGGKGANQAVAAARLGARVTFLGRVGADDRGRALLHRLKAEGVNVQHVVRDPRTPTGVALISVDAHGEKQIVVAPGANQRLTPADIRRPVVTRAIQQADILILQFEIPRKTNLAAAHLAHQAGVPVVLDPAPALEGAASSAPKSKARWKTTAAPLLKLVTVLRANEHEAEALTGIRVTDRRTAQKAAEYLLINFKNLRAAIIAAGKGNLAVWRGDAAAIANFSIAHHPSALTHLYRLYIPRLPVKTLDATGAGDAFAAALAVALAEGQPIPDAATFANAAAALATTKLGAQGALPKRAAVLAHLHRRQMQPIKQNL